MEKRTSYSQCYDRKNKMKFFSILSNLFLLGVAIWWITLDGFSSLGSDDCLLLFPMLITPILSLPYLFCYKGEDWLSLYLKRKAIEEKRKIEQLNQDKNKS